MNSEEKKGASRLQSSVNSKIPNTGNLTAGKELSRVMLSGGYNGKRFLVLFSLYAFLRSPHLYAFSLVDTSTWKTLSSVWQIAACPAKPNANVTLFMTPLPATPSPTDDLDSFLFP